MAVIRSGFKISLLSLAFISLVHAAPNVLFTVSDAVPKGFKAIAKPETMLVDVRFEDIYLGTYKAVVSPSTIQFIHPEHFLKKIHNLHGQQHLGEMLNSKQSIHSSAICHSSYTAKSCGVLYPTTIGVIYNPNTFTANIFINSKFIKRPQYKGYHLLPDSTAGWSYTNNLSGIVSGSTNKSLNGLVDLGIPQTNNNYNLTTDNVIAYKNNRIRISASYANHTHGSSNVIINQANFQSDHGVHSYTAGIIQTNGTQFFPNINILGGAFASTLNTLPDAINSSAMPVIIFLSLPSQVAIYKNGQLIFSKYKQGGYQRINTVNFPEGAYQLTIKTTDSQGNVHVNHMYYVKSGALPPLNLPQYGITVGYLMATQQYDVNVGFKVLKIPVYQLYYDWRINDTTGMSINSLGTDRNFFVAAGPTWLHGPTQLSVGLLAGSSKRYGISTNFSYYFKRFGASINYIQLFNNVHSGDFDSNLMSVNQGDSPFYDRLLTVSQRQIDGSLSYEFPHNVSFSLAGSYNKSVSSQRTYRYGATVDKSIEVGYGDLLNLSLSATHSNRDYSVNASIVFTFDHPNMTASLQASYLHQRDLDSNELPTYNENDGPHAAATAHWFKHDSNNYGYNVGVHGSATENSQNLGSTYDNMNHYADISGYANYNHAKTFGSTAQYGGELRTQFNWTPGAMTLSNSILGDSSGTLVVVSSPDNDSEFILHTMERPNFVIKPNHYYYLPLTPYQQYNIQIANGSMNAYKIKDIQKVVTLYPGNIQLLHWQATEQTIMIGRLVGARGKVIANAALTGELGENFSDAHGYFQIETDKSKPLIFAKFNGHRCRLLLPKINIMKEYTYLGEVQCKAVSSSQR